MWSPPQRLFQRGGQPGSEGRVLKLVSLELLSARDRKFSEKIFECQNVIGSDAVLFHEAAIERRVFPGIPECLLNSAELKPPQFAFRHQLYLRIPVSVG